MQRAYSLLTVKAFDDDTREITGIATTPEPDRYGDIVESAGAEFELPIPLIWQHDAQRPVGKVVRAKVTKDGIDVVARLVKPQAGDPKSWAERLDEAWADIKHGLVRGLSIGFKPLEYAYMDDGGIRFSKWLWLELSPVTIPANGECSIQAVKSMDQAHTAAAGHWRRPIRLTPFDAGVTAKAASPISGGVKLIQEMKP